MTEYNIRIVGYFGFVLHPAFPTIWSIWKTESASAILGRDAKDELGCVQQKGLLSATGQWKQSTKYTCISKIWHFNW
jgi:hypothetical protein